VQARNELVAATSNEESTALELKHTEITARHMRQDLKNEEQALQRLQVRCGI
jgi:hypothetical protein